jgi:hypothetical protein
MEHTEDNIEWATSQITKFLHLRNAPQHESVIRSHALAWLDIFHDRQRADPCISKCVATFDFRYPNPILVRKVYNVTQRPADGVHASQLEAEAESGGLV